MTTISEADVEQIALDRLSELGWQTAYLPDIDRDHAQVDFGYRLRTQSKATKFTQSSGPSAKPYRRNSPPSVLKSVRQCRPQASGRTAHGTENRLKNLKKPERPNSPN
jgi:hypothetical protein